MTIPLCHVDAFTDQPFAGNPAAVCILTDQRPDAWMQQVGAEMNLSETAFVQKQDDGVGPELKQITGKKCRYKATCDAALGKRGQEDRR
jgi:PhzF family phenazine biosynthesis protein